MRRGVAKVELSPSESWTFGCWKLSFRTPKVALFGAIFVFFREKSCMFCIIIRKLPYVYAKTSAVRVSIFRVKSLHFNNWWVGVLGRLGILGSLGILLKVVVLPELLGLPVFPVFPVFPAFPVKTQIKFVFLLAKSYLCKQTSNQEMTWEKHFFLYCCSFL